MLKKSTGESAVETCEENVVIDQGKQFGVVNISEMSSNAAMNSTFGSVSGNAVCKASARISDASISDDNLVHSKSEGPKILKRDDGCFSSVSGTDEYANKKSDIEDSRINCAGKCIFYEEISEKVPSSSSPTGLSSPSSVSVEITPSKSSDNATELQNTFSHASNGKNMLHNPNSGEIEDDKPSDTKGKFLEGSTELLNSSLSKELASDVAYGDRPALDHNPREKNNDTDCANQPIDDTDDSDMVEEDVKVCDICGDAGREESLAVCCWCSDGAEHIYCMREMLDKVPDGDWMCEECKSLERVTYERPEKMGRVDENERNNCSGQANREHVNSFDIEEHRTKGYTKNSGKRLRDDGDAEDSPIVKKPSHVSIAESPMTSNSSNTTALSCENSMRNIERGRLQTSHHSSSEIAPVNDTPVSARTTSNLGVQQFRGTFSKSNSFNSLNSKPKVKPIDQVVLQKQMSTREHGSFRLKEGVGRSIGKSTSFKSTSSSQSETKMKTLPPRLSQIQDTKNTKQRSSFERHSSFKTGHPSANSVMESSTPDINKNPVSGDGSPSLTTINNHHDVKPVHTDVKSATLSRSCSIAARRNADLSGEFKRQSFNRDGELRVLSTSGANNTEQKSDLTSPNEDSTPCPVVAERSPTNEGLTDGSSRSRDSANSGEEVREYSGSHFRASSVKSSRDEDNIVKAAIEAALLRKPGVCRKHRTLSQSGNSCASHLRDTVANVAPAMPFLLKSLAIPQHEYIWKGSFEICQSGKVFDSWDGIQAHLSTCASSKVIEAVNNFKSRIVLYEVPRLRTWPIQFQDHGVRDNNIALFFFAKDLESYDKIYKYLLDNMMKNDLALKGNFNGVELLIFPSNQLPDNFQRWNMLFFLWGVFRGKKESCMQHMPESSEQLSAPQDKPPARVSLLESRCSVGPISNDLPASEHAEGLGSLLSSRAVNGETSSKISSLDQPDSGVSCSSAVQSDSRCKELSTACVEVGIISSPPETVSSTENSEREHVLMQVDASLDTQQSTLEDFNNSTEGIGDRATLDMGTCDDLVKSKMDTGDLSTNEEAPFQKDRDPNYPNANEELSGDTYNEASGTLEKMNNRCHETRGSPKKKENDESHLFPMEKQYVTDGSMARIGQKQVDDGAVPDLELALGAEMKSLTHEDNQPQLVGKKTDEEHIFDEAKTKDDEPEPASLSLSLSFPF